MVSQCCVRGCKSRAIKTNKHIKFYRIPRIITYQGTQTTVLSTERQRLWLQCIGPRPGNNVVLTPSLSHSHLENLRVCSLHFPHGRPSKLYDQNTEDWVPSIKIWDGQIIENTDKKRKGSKRNPNYKTNDSLIHSNNETCLEIKPSTETITAASNEVTGEEMILPATGDDDISYNNVVIKEEIPDEVEMDVGFEQPCVKMMEEISTQTNSSSFNLKDSGTQTIFRVTYMHDLEIKELELKELQEKLRESKDKCAKLQNEVLKITYSQPIVKVEPFSVTSFNKDNNKVRFFTGLQTLHQLCLINEDTKLNWPSGIVKLGLTEFQQIVLTLMKLRLGSSYMDLAYRFDVPCESVGKIFNAGILALHKTFNDKIVYERKVLLENQNSPDIFKEFVENNVGVIFVECFELFFCKINETRKCCVKVVVASNCNGKIFHVSCEMERATAITDFELTESCGLLNKLQPGDVILSNTGFDLIDGDSLFCAEVVNDVEGAKKLSRKNLELNENLLDTKIHLRKTIGAIKKKYAILNSQDPIEFMGGEDQICVDNVRKLVLVCSALTNMAS